MSHLTQSVGGNLLSKALATVLSSVAVIFLYASIVIVGSYNLTIGTLAAFVVIILSFRSISFRPLPIMLCIFFLFWPLIVMSTATTVDAQLTPTVNRFFASYALWATSVVIITLAFVTRKPLQINLVFGCLIFLLILMLVQFVGAKVFHSRVGFNIVAPLFGFDIFHSYLGLNRLDGVRAIGTYYEPSMCGRVVGTLCFVDYLKNKRAVRPLVLGGVAILLTQSLGLLVLMVVMGVILMARNARGVLAICVAAVLVSALAMPFLEKRLSGQENAGSTHTRILAPIAAVDWAIESYPVGAPIGSAEMLARKTGYFAETGEIKITNGVYEFLTYFGFLSLIAILAIVFFIFYLFSVGRREEAAGLSYLLLSTALSGSFLSVESSLLTYFFIVATRKAAAEKLREKQRKRIGVDIFSRTYSDFSHHDKRYIVH